MPPSLVTTTSAIEWAISSWASSQGTEGWRPFMEVLPYASSWILTYKWFSLRSSCMRDGSRNRYLGCAAAGGVSSGYVHRSHRFGILAIVVTVIAAIDGLVLNQSQLVRRKILAHGDAGVERGGASVPGAPRS